VQGNAGQDYECDIYALLNFMDKKKLQFDYNKSSFLTNYIRRFLRDREKRTRKGTNKDMINTWRRAGFPVGNDDFRFSVDEMILINILASMKHLDKVTKDNGNQTDSAGDQGSAACISQASGSTVAQTSSAVATTHAVAQVRGGAAGFLAYAASGGFRPGIAHFMVELKLISQAT
jgi:hypothetical protein